MPQYAPEYSREERIQFIIKELIWAAPLYLLCQFWFFDWLAEYSEHAHCYFYGPITGVHLVMYGLFCLMPFSFGVMFFQMLGKDALETINVGQHPLPNKKVFSKTQYVYGARAKLKGYAVVLCIACFFLFSIWGITAAKKITSDVKPCESPLEHSGSMIG